MVKISKSELSSRIFLILSAIFIASLVTCNLIANKFVEIDLGFHVFIISAGVLPYPITFLVTDILSEIYGKKKTNWIVFSGFIASLFVLLFLWLGAQFYSIESSPVNDNVYDMVFRNAWRIIGASMIAYLSAQFLDVKLFHFWKNIFYHQE